MKSVYLDTNIVLDLLDSRRPNHSKIAPLMEKIIRNDMQVYMSEDSLTTIYYIAKNKKEVLEFFGVILDEWHVVPFGTQVIAQAIEICKANEKFDFEDALQCLCAKGHGCDCLITSDKNFVDCGIEVVDIDAFLAMKAV